MEAFFINQIMDQALYELYLASAESMLKLISVSGGDYFAFVGMVVCSFF